MVTATHEQNTGRDIATVARIAIERPRFDVFAHARNWKSSVATARLADPFLSRNWLNERVSRTQPQVTVPAFQPVWETRELAGVAA